MSKGQDNKKDSKENGFNTKEKKQESLKNLNKFLGN